ncbi:MAG: hypothetical protein KKF76_19725 [Gammaproteobacteria bacterium]|nr:hypothetical protein [Gammaproteobacteria bacterium]
MNFIKPLIISILLVNTSVAEELIKPLSPSFLGSHEIHFSNTASDGDEKALTAELIQEGGQRMVLPVRCNPEGGEPSLSSSYSLALPDGPNALVITCSYDLDHSGLGLKGTQYISYVFKEASGSIERVETLEQLISGYEGDAEKGERQYYFYPTSELAKQKLKDGETDSPKLIHQVVLTRLANRDYEAIRSYTSNRKNMETIRKPPTAKRDISIYNDIGYALAEANELDLALCVLRNVEEISPERTVLMLNLADVLWEKGLQEEAKPYYQQYYSKMENIGKKRLVPMRVMTRLPK